MIQLKFYFAVRDHKEIIIITLLAYRKSISDIIRKSDIKYLLFDIMLLKVADDCTVLFKVDLLQGKHRTHGVKNRIVRPVGAVAKKTAVKKLLGSQIAILCLLQTVKGKGKIRIVKQRPSPLL